MDILKTTIKINTYPLLLPIITKEVLKKYIKLWDEVKYHIQTINDDEFGEYGKDYMKIKFYSDDNLPLNKILKFSVLTIIIRHVFEKVDKYYPQIFLD